MIQIKLVTNLMLVGGRGYASSPLSQVYNRIQCVTLVGSVPFLPMTEVVQSHEHYADNDEHERKSHHRQASELFSVQAVAHYSLQRDEPDSVRG